MINSNITFKRCEASTYMYYRFNELHYLDKDGANRVSQAASCYLFYYCGKVAGFCSIINRGRNNCPEAVMFNRIVVLEQYRRKGICTYMISTIAGMYYNKGNKVYIMTSNKYLDNYCKRHSDEWIATSNNGKYRKYNNDKDEKYKNRKEGVHYHYRYMGDLITENEDYLLPVNEMRLNNRIININNM